MSEIIDLKGEPVVTATNPYTCETCASLHVVTKDRRECRRYPPKSFLVGMQPHPLDPNQQSPLFMSVFPGVNFGMTCDEWNEPAEEEAPQYPE